MPVQRPCDDVMLVAPSSQAVRTAKPHLQPNVNNQCKQSTHFNFLLRHSSAQIRQSFHTLHQHGDVDHSRLAGVAREYHRSLARTGHPLQSPTSLAQLENRDRHFTNHSEEDLSATQGAICNLTSRLRRRRHQYLLRNSDLFTHNSHQSPLHEQKLHTRPPGVSRLRHQNGAHEGVRQVDPLPSILPKPHDGASDDLLAHKDSERIDPFSFAVMARNVPQPTAGHDSNAHDRISAFGSTGFEKHVQSDDS